ncbi:hypothetical protein R5W23_001897 [Gemmata sp. JC673]|uniref:Uncharacterized protein n=1 Tax=Gemmata algarum TaxID=2975278 RepID=A0ABU5F407_9BACT|nr:hypothetical protein [Gemmata algarum]MDY3560651.1 hypothetical protein [Gemmata algarum]
MDSALASQQVPASDVTVALNGQAALVVELVAPVATFAQGQLEAVSLIAVAVAGDVAAIIDTAGTLSPVSVTNPAPPLNPITPPVPGVGPIDWQAMLTSYGIKIATLDSLATQIVSEMQRFDGLEALIKDLRIKARFAATPEERLGFTMFADAYLDQLLGSSQRLANLTSQYGELYLTAAAQFAFLEGALPAELRAFLVPPPELPEVPSLYYAPLSGLV